MRNLAIVEIASRIDAVRLEQLFARGDRLAVNIKPCHLGSEMVVWQLIFAAGGSGLIVDKDKVNHSFAFSDSCGWCVGRSCGCC